MLHPFFCPVVKILMRKDHLPTQAFDVNTVVMILRSDLNPAGCKILYRMIATMMPEFQLIRSPS